MESSIPRDPQAFFPWVGVHLETCLFCLLLRRYLRAAGPTVLHSHLFPAQLLSAAVTNSEVRLVTTEHSTNNKRRGKYFWKPVDLLMYSRFTRIIAISEAVGQALADWVHFTRHKIVCIHNGVAVDSIRFSEAAPSSLRLVSIGRLVEVKNFLRSVRAVAALRCEGLAIEYDIYGEGPQRSLLETEVRQLGAAQFIRIKGRSEELDKLLLGYSAILIPSIWEGFGLVAVEAMAAGLPVICSNVPGLSEVIDHKFAFLFDPTRQDEIQVAISRAISSGYLTDSRIRLRMRERAKQYDLPQMVDQHLKIYAQLLAPSTSV
jgi:glycosyltransferase involved in cell wall biosynthesis